MTGEKRLKPWKVVEVVLEEVKESGVAWKLLLVLATNVVLVLDDKNDECVKVRDGGFVEIEPPDRVAVADMVR